jgi:hypothetical protein
LLTDEEGKARWRRVQPTVIPQQPGADRRDPALWLGLGLLLMLGGCSDVPDRINPVSWWHHLEGGEIAQDRPPPPNPNAPFPKIAAQPTRPAGMPDWEWNQLSATLAATRSSAQAYAAQNPIPTLSQTAPPPAAARPKPVRVTAAPAAPAPAPPADSTQSAATAAEIARLAAAPGPAGSQTPAPSATAVATATANAKAGNSTTSALTFQGPSARPPASGPQSVPIRDAVGTKISAFDPNNGLSIPGALDPVEQPDEAHPPPVPASVPAPPVVPGFAISTVPATYVAPVALPQPAPYVPPAPLPAVPPVPIQFARHSAVLTPPMQKALLNLAQASRGARMAVTGFGDAASDKLSDQVAAMPLALERARAMVVQLMAYGAAETGISTSAHALGSGGLARLGD